MDINFDSSKHFIDAADDESDAEDDDNDQAGYDDQHFDKRRILQYRIIVPPIHQGSRRYFRDYEELPKVDDLELVAGLPPSESFMDSLRSSPLAKARSTQIRKDSKQSRRRSKSHQSFIDNKMLDVLQDENEGAGDGAIETTEDALNNLPTNDTVISAEQKGKYLRPKTAVVACRTHSRAHSPTTVEQSSSKKTNRETEEKHDQNNDEKSEKDNELSKTSRTVENSRNEFLKLPETHNALTRTQSADGVRKHKRVARRLSVDERKQTQGLSRKHSSEENAKNKSETKPATDVSEDNANAQTSLAVEDIEKLTISPNKLLPRRKSMDEGIKIHINKPENDFTDENSDELREEARDVLTAETIDLELLPEDVCWTQMITRTTLASHEDTFPNKNPLKRRSEMHFKGSLLFPRQSDETSVTSYASNRKRTDSFNSTANSQATVKGRRKSTASQLITDADRRHRKMSNNEVIYDARPDKALSKGYSTMQMTIGGKQVKICVPKFSKDDVIDRARAKSAAQMADERTRGHTTVKHHKQIKQPAQ